MPEINDPRAFLIKGLFQETLIPFLGGGGLNGQLIIHMDADLFTSTLFALCTLAPYLKAGDVIIFDEFCVPAHEFRAYRIFTDTFLVNLRLKGAVNNYLQCAFEVI
jgi:hypothetical protein